MKYQEALEYINHIQASLGSDYSLRDVTELAARMGRPERKLNVIHIAGTNGKGSVANYIANILTASGYTAGKYVSPTIFDYRERIQFGKRTSQETVWKYITEKETADCLSRLKEQCEQMTEEGYGQPTAFEIETVMAFMMFAKWQVDFAIIETGLGGRVDATNIVECPLQCIFSSISCDHMAFLGDTIEKIAQEKYGIIKKGAQVIAPEEIPAKNLLAAICQQTEAEVTFVKKAAIGKLQYCNGCQKFHYQDTEYTLRQLGTYQAENAALAIESAKQLQKAGYTKITQQTIQQGIFESRWKGRFDILSKHPFLLADGAHNPDAAKRLKESLSFYFPGEQFAFIVGMFRDKEYEKVLSEILPLAEQVYTVTAPGPRGLDKEVLRQTIRNLLAGQKSAEKQEILSGEKKSAEEPAEKILQEMTSAQRKTLSEKIVTSQTIEEALEEALSQQKDKKTVVCGSLSILGEVYAYEKQRKVDEI